jgi:hypothetical protein
MPGSKEDGETYTLVNSISRDIRNPAVSRTHLLNRITEPLKNIHILALARHEVAGTLRRTQGET